MLYNIILVAIGYIAGAYHKAYHKEIIAFIKSKLSRND